MPKYILNVHANKKILAIHIPALTDANTPLVYPKEVIKAGPCSHMKIVLVHESPLVPIK